MPNKKQDCDILNIMRGFTLLSLLSLRKRSCQGFTLMELLIVIALLSLIMVFVMPNIKNIRDEQGLNSAALEFQSNIRATQNNALSGLKCSSSTQSAVNWQINLVDDKSYQI